MSKQNSLFIGFYPCGVVYADRSKYVDGDYKKVAFLSYRELQLVWEPGSYSEKLTRKITEHAAKIQSKKGQKLQISTSGQFVILGQ